jgi:hypothetical protein
MMMRKWMLGVLTVLMVTGCAAPQPTRPQSTPAVAAVPTATRARAARPTPTPTLEATATATASPTVAPSATATTAPTATPSPSPTAIPAAAAAQSASAAPSGASGVLLALNPRKFPAPALLTPSDNATYHVSQPVVHLTWSNVSQPVVHNASSDTPTNLLTFGQMPGCVSDDTNFRRAFESYQLVIHSLDAPRADQVQWTVNSTVFDLNLTTVPAGRYSWSVNVVTLCQSYVVGKRNDTRPLYDNRNNDPAFHESTLQNTYLGPVSPTSATRIITWVP